MIVAMPPLVCQLTQVSASGIFASGSLHVLNAGPTQFDQVTVSTLARPHGIKISADSGISGATGNSYPPALKSSDKRRFWVSQPPLIELALGVIFAAQSRLRRITAPTSLLTVIMVSALWQVEPAV